VDNSLARVLAHTHRTTTAALSLRISMVDPSRTSWRHRQPTQRLLRLASGQDMSRGWKHSFAGLRSVLG
jgi:hypothetical protein